jgi:hypothetical protein
MKNRLFFLLLTLVIALSVLAHAQKDDDDDDDDNALPKHPPVMKPTEKPAAASFACPYDKDFQKPHKIGAYTVRILPTVKDKDDKDDKDQDADPRCRAVLTSAAGKRITIAYEWALTIDPISGSDLNGDGTPDLVLSGYSGGLHCCYVYEIVSLGRAPKELHTFQNPVPITFEKQPDGTALIRAADGVFDYFIVPHTDAVIPQLVLKLQGNDLVDVSAKYPEVYDKEIEQARSQITADELDKFKKSNYHANLYTDQVPTVHKVLTIVLDYVYSGREEKAWQALDELWPAGDVSRVKSLIAERRNRGMLANLACDCKPAMIPKPTRVKRKPSPPDEISDPRVKSIIDD